MAWFLKATGLRLTGRANIYTDAKQKAIRREPHGLKYMKTTEMISQPCKFQEDVFRKYIVNYK